MLIYIIRHGETNWNVASRLQGWVEEPLNANGIGLARVTGQAWREIPFDLAYTSPLTRARQTAEICVAEASACQRKEIPIIEDDRLKEMSFGAWEGLSMSAEHFEIPTSPENFQLLFTDARSFVNAEDGESIEELIARCDEFLQELIHNPEYEDKTILVATHGCAMRALLNRYYDDPQDFWQTGCPYNCAVNIIEAHNGEARLIAEDQIYYDPALAVNFYDPEA